MKLTRDEMETVINFSAGDNTVTIYTRDPAVMRKVDELVNAFPDTYVCVSDTSIDKTYELPKSSISYRKPRIISEEQRRAASERMRRLNGR